ncbi:DUF3048 domain-containing protein [Nocardioides panaciterrulae]|uniref:DUF3048 domain-containing protein n=1 Tax=Nocardioides panaciterrulae TaxID=661492 RepID=A0A7Y9JC02_9ACTN|nr:hypothetical protein [Nocardioides panaciterrulae]
MRRAPLPLAVLVSASLLLAGCGGGDDGSPSSESSSPAAQKVAGGATLDATWPLTGLPVSGDQSASQDHPVLVAKMDNTASSAPQIGLGKADMVVEELVEGGLTRLAAFYYSQIPGTVGPVRSMRASDVGIVSPVDADVVTSGAAPRTIALIKNAGIRFFGEGTKGFARDNSRPAPYNLFANLSEVASTIKQGDKRPADYLPWGDEKDLPKGVAAKTMAAQFSGGHTTDWVYRGGGYINENTYAADGDEFPADTVLVLRVQEGDAGYLDPAGNHVPETKLVGKGAAMLFHGGRMVRGTWSKDKLDSPLQLSTKGGKLTVPAGHTWIELVPAQGGNVTFKK